MAQIIKHRRGGLESVSGATKREGELLVITGSTGISADNGDGLLFIGIDNSTVTPSNKILTGSSTPDLTGVTYDSSINGIPFYNTSLEKLFILGKGGNVEVKSSANTDGTGIVSSSAQVVDYLLNETVNFGTGDISGSNLYLSGNANIDGNITLGGNITIGDASSDTISFGGEVSSDIIPSADNTHDIGSSTDRFAEIHGTTIFGSISATNGVVSGSSQIELAFTDSSSFDTDNVGEGSNLYYTDTRVKTKLDTETVISGSSQVFTDVSGDITIASNGTAAISSGVIVNDDVKSDAAISHTKIDFGGSQITSGSLNFGISGSSGNDVVQIGVDALTFAGTTNEIETTVTNNQVQIGIVENPTLTGNVIVTGNLTVSGDTVQTNVSTMNVEDNIINLNYGGSQTTGGIYVTDATGDNTVSGSLIWDGSNGADYWKAGPKDSEARVIVGNGTDTAGTITKFSADGVITDSIITESGTTVTISNDLILAGLTASAFLVSNGSKQLVSVSTTTDGDILVSDGAGNFSATNTIDGGTF